jgi:pimeloyl-ACP methyl ester carboxylesterase
MKGFHSLGFPVLRFNFRGTGLSAGVHGGREETNDVTAALRWLKQEFSLPVIFAGFSFGAARGLRACCPDPEVPLLISLGTPLEAEGRLYSYKFLSTCNKPKLFLSGDHDQFGPHDALEEVVALAAEPKELVFISAIIFRGPPQRNALDGGELAAGTTEHARLACHKQDSSRRVDVMSLRSAHPPQSPEGSVAIEMGRRARHPFDYALASAVSQKLFRGVPLR